MKPKDLKEFFEHFPEGSELIMLEAPPGLEEIVKSAPFILTPDGTYWCIMEFESHDEWKEFQKNRQLLVTFMSTPAPFSIGAFHVGEVKGEENSLLELQSEESRSKN